MQNKTISDLKASARGHLEGNYANSALIIVAFIFLSSITGLMSSTSGATQTFLLNLIILATAIIVSTIPYLLKAGLFHFFLKLCCNANSDIKDVFCAFKINGKRNFAYSLLMMIIENLCLLPGSFYLYKSLAIDSTFNTVAIVLLVAGVLVYALINVCFSQVFFLMFDFPDKKMTELIQLSLYLMKGQKLRFVIMWLSFIPLLFVSYLTCGIGLLWVLPYKYSTYACFYLELTKKGSNK